MSGVRRGKVETGEDRQLGLEWAGPYRPLRELELFLCLRLGVGKVLR